MSCKNCESLVDRVARLEQIWLDWVEHCEGPGKVPYMDLTDVVDRWVLDTKQSGGELNRDWLGEGSPATADHCVENETQHAQNGDSDKVNTSTSNQ